MSALSATVGDVILRQTESHADEVLHLELHLLSNCYARCVVCLLLLLLMVVVLVVDKFTVTHRK